MVLRFVIRLNKTLSYQYSFKHELIFYIGYHNGELGIMASRILKHSNVHLRQLGK
jgi:hypothetical protein